MTVGESLMEAGPLHKLTRAELAAKYPCLLDRHRAAVEAALRWEGRMRPAVMADYPDLQKRVCGCGRNVTGYTPEGYPPECANCWEVERRLDEYLDTLKGQQFVLGVLIRKRLLANTWDFRINAKE